jgi:hypothetical protein
MTSEIKDFLSSCEICCTFQRQQPKEPLVQHETPLRPWEKVGVDLASVGDKDFLVCVDYFSNFAEVDFLEDTKAETVIHKLRIQFSRHGVPDTVFSDNGPQFSCEKFRDFSRAWQFRHITSSPAYPQSNGKVENAIKTLKGLIYKAQKDKRDPYLAILDFRNTPTQALGVSPAQRLFNRRTKTLLPTTASLLRPRINPGCALKAKTELYRSKMKENYDKTASRPLPELRSGDVVRIQPTRLGVREWTQGSVQGSADETGRSYLVKTPSGQVLRRNRRHIRRTQERAPEIPREMVDNQAQDQDNQVQEQDNLVQEQDNLVREQENQDQEQEPDSAARSTPEAVKEPLRVPCVPKVIITRSGRQVKRPSKFMD